MRSGLAERFPYRFGRSGSIACACFNEGTYDGMRLSQLLPRKPGGAPFKRDQLLKLANAKVVIDPAISEALSRRSELCPGKHVLVEGERRECREIGGSGHCEIDR